MIRPSQITVQIIQFLVATAISEYYHFNALVEDEFTNNSVFNNKCFKALFLQQNIQTNNG